jgi:hypothetical protein
MPAGQPSSSAANLKSHAAGIALFYLVRKTRLTDQSPPCASQLASRREEDEEEL